MWADDKTWHLFVILRISIFNLQILLHNRRLLHPSSLLSSKNLPIDTFGPCSRPETLFYSMILFIFLNIRWTPSNSLDSIDPSPSKHSWALFTPWVSSFGFSKSRPKSLYRHCRKHMSDLEYCVANIKAVCDEYYFYFIEQSLIDGTRSSFRRLFLSSWPGILPIHIHPRVEPVP